MNRRTTLTGLLTLLATPALARTRPGAWAQPLDMPGLKNLYQVTPALYRSAQPDAAGFKILAQQLKIKTVLNLHDEAPDDALAAGTGITCVQVPMNSFRVFSHHNKKLIAALHHIRKGLTVGPTLVHCVHGKDRTGGVMAAWRMVEQNWTADAAIQEMQEGGFGYSGWLFSNSRSLKKLDVAAIRQRLNAM